MNTEHHAILGTVAPTQKIAQRDERRRTSLDPASALEAMFAVCVVFIASGAVFPLLRQPNGESAVAVGGGGEGGILAGAYLIAIALLATRWRQVARLLKSNFLFLLLPLLALCSVVWSTDPARSLRDAVALISSMAFGVYLAMRFEGHGLLRIAAWTMTIIAALSVATALLYPAFGIDVAVHQGQWRGVYLSKNAFGRMMAFAFMTFLILAWHGRHARTMSALMALVCLALVGLSQSKTALGVCFLMLLLVIASPLMQRCRIRMWLVGLIVLLTLTGLAYVTLLSRDGAATGAASEETLTGRTVLWAAVAAKILLRPWLGYGYTAFWEGSHGDYVDVWRIVGWNPPHSHNGFLDVALDVGVLGLALFVWVFVAELTRAAQLPRLELDPAEKYWPVAVIAFVLLTNLTETTFLRSNVFWMFFTAAATIGMMRVQRSEERVAINA